MDPTDMRATAIRAELQKRGLDSKGTKVYLISRLQFALDEERRQQIENPTDIAEEAANNEIAVDESEQIECPNENADNCENSDDESGGNDNDGGVLNVSVPEFVCVDENACGEDDEAAKNEIDALITLDVAFCPSEDNKANFVQVAGRRANSCLLYSLDENQFYKKNKKLKSGLVSHVCRHENCHRHVYFNPLTNDCIYQVPYEAHNHSDCVEEFDRLGTLNKMKAECATPQSVADSTESKTSVVKSIFAKNLVE